MLKSDKIPNYIPNNTQLKASFIATPRRFQNLMNAFANIALIGLCVVVLP